MTQKPIKLGLRALQKFQGDRLAFIVKAEQEVGGVAHYEIFGRPFILISDPEVIHTLLVKHPQDLNRDKFVGQVFRRMTGEGVFVAEGAAWQRQRKLVQPAFHALRIQAYTDTMVNYTREMVEKWSATDERQINLDLTQLTLRIIAKTMFDVDLADWVETLGQYMRAILGESERQLVAGWVAPAWWPGPGNQRQQAALKKIKALLLEIINQRRASGKDTGDLLSMLLAARDDQNQPMSDKQLIDECLTLLIAGHETTAAALTWTCYLLGQNPTVQTQLRTDIDAVLGGQPLEFKALANLPYLEMVVKETLRLYPPAWSFSRTTLRDITVVGHNLPKDSLLMISPYAFQRSARYFEAPEQFKPERFGADAPAYHPYAYLPFGGGPRVCVGNQFAMLEAQAILATMLQNVEWNYAGPPPELSTLVTLQPEGGLKINVTRRSLLVAQEGN